MALQIRTEPKIGPRMLNITMFNRTTIRVFLVWSGLEWFTEENWRGLIDDVGGHIKSGNIEYQERFHEGFDRIPDAHSSVFTNTENTR